MSKVFITGGTGLIGSHLAKALVGQGHDVVLYDAFMSFVPFVQSRYQEFLRYRMEGLYANPKVAIVRGDTRSSQSLGEALLAHQPDAVVHLAALPIAKESMEYPHEATSINLGGTVTLLECLRLAKSVKRLVFASSSFVYGHFEREPADEEHPCRPIDVYGVTKLSGEMLTRVFCAQAGVEHVVVRPSAVYGFTDSNRRITQIFVERALAGQPLTLHDGGTARLDFTYVEDIAAGLALAALHPAAKGETFNITRGRARSVADLAEAIREYIPDVELISQPTDMVRPNRGTLDVSKARRLLGYHPTWDIEDGMRVYIERLRAVTPGSR